MCVKLHVCYIYMTIYTYINLTIHTLKPPTIAYIYITSVPVHTYDSTIPYNNILCVAYTFYVQRTSANPIVE